MQEQMLDVEATAEGTLVETVRIADPKDPFGVKTLVREWIGGGFYRSTEAPPVPDAVPASLLEIVR